MCHTQRVKLNSMSIRRQPLLSKYFLLYRLPSTVPFDSVKILDADVDIKVPCKSMKYKRNIYEGESNENLKTAIKIRNTARLSCKLTTMILMV